jgi:pyruvate, water dikinase
VTDRILWLDDPDCHNIEVTGGKGASLARMRDAGMPVPPGFVITAGAMRDSLTKQGVLDRVAALALTFDGASDGNEMVADIQGLITAAPLWDDLADEIEIAYAALGDDSFVAVRSSACAEDGEAASFAGQQETFLNVVGTDDVLGKVVECWASFFSERALFYRLKKGSLNDLGMAVVVQRQIASDTSGVMFTTDPIRQRTDQMVIEAAYGLGEAVVSGLVTPDNYVVRRDGRLKNARVGRQDVMIVRSADGGTTTVALDEETSTSQVLDEDEIRHLASVGLQLEAAFGAPQDIEWAFAGRELYVLQSRPITA